MTANSKLFKLKKHIFSWGLLDSAVIIRHNPVFMRVCGVPVICEQQAKERKKRMDTKTKNLLDVLERIADSLDSIAGHLHNIGVDFSDLTENEKKLCVYGYIETSKTEEEGC